MKRRLGKYLACLLALAMALSLGTVGAYAAVEEPKADILKLSYSTDGNTWTAFTTTCADNHWSVAETGLDLPGEFVWLKAETGTGLTAENITSLSISWQCKTNNSGITAHFGYPDAALGTAVKVPLSALGAYGDYDGLDVTFETDLGYPNAWGTYHLEDAIVGDARNNLDTSFLDDWVGSYRTEGSDTALTITKDAGGNYITAISDEVKSDGTSATDRIADINYTVTNDGKVSDYPNFTFGYSVNAYFDMGVDSAGNKTLTAKDTYSYNDTATTKNGTITGGAVFTSTAEAKIGNTRYETLAAAVAAAKTGETVTLLQDVTLTDTLTINTDQAITIDLNGCDIERTQKVIVVERGNVTFTGTGTIRETAPGNGALVLKGSADPAATDYTVVTVGENVTLEGFAGAFVTPHISGTSPYAYGVTLNLNGKIVSKANASNGGGYGLYVNGQIQHTENYPVINIGATAQVSSVGTAIYAAGYADWRIASGAELTGVTSGIGIKSGKLTVSGGTITCTGPNNAPTEGFSNGMNASGAAIQIESNSDYAGAMEISITGGSVVSQNGYSIYEYIGKTGEDTDVTKLSVSSGSFQGGICISEELAGNALSKFITGGTWSVDPTTYVATGYSVRTNSDSTYTVYNPSSGGSGSSSTPIKTVEVSGESESVQVPYKQSSDGTVELVMDAETIADVIHERAETGTVSIDLTTVEDATAAVIPADAVQAIAAAAEDPENDADGLAVLLPEATVELDAAALASIAAQTEGKALSVAVEPVAAKDLTDEQKEALPAGAVVYDVTIEDGSAAISSFDGTITVTVPYVLKEGERAGAIFVWYLADDGSLTKMPAAYDAETKTVRFTTTHLSKYVVGHDDSFHLCDAFTDIQNHCAKNSICFAVENSLMNGVSDTLFDPDAAMTRAMLATVLWRQAGEPAMGGGKSGTFTDVAEYAWYTEAVEWAAANGLVEGYGDGRFGPGDSITREQLVTLLWRYAQYMGEDVSVGEDTNILSYKDFDAISEYAVPAFQWACGAGLVEGQGEETLVPMGTATRAEVATILARYLA